MESVFEVLAGAHNLRPNPDPIPDPNPNPNPDPSNVVTRLTMEGKGANGTTIKGYPRPGSRGMSKNTVAYTFQVETVGPAYEVAMDRGLKVTAGLLAKQWKTSDIKLVWHDADSNYHATQCMSTVSAMGVWGVAPGRVTSDEINDAVVDAGFTEPIAIVTRTMKHPSKAASLHVCAFFFSMGGTERAEARDRLLGLEGLRLIQKRIPSEEEASELAVQQRIREDGSIQSTTLILSVMMASSWPANPTEWKHDEIPHPADWSSVQICSDKKHPHYLGRLVLKEGVGEAKMEKTLKLMDRLGELWETILDGIGDTQSKEQAERMSLFLKAAPQPITLTLTLTLTQTLTLTLTTTVKLTLRATLKARTNLAMKAQVKELTEVTGIGHPGNNGGGKARIGHTDSAVVSVGARGRRDTRGAALLDTVSVDPPELAGVVGHGRGREEGLRRRAGTGAAGSSNDHPQDGGIPAHDGLGQRHGRGRGLDDRLGPGEKTGGHHRRTGE